MTMSDAARRWRTPAVTLLSLVVAATTAACGPPDRFDTAIEVAGGEPAEGKRLMRAYGCNDCHTIPGVRNANTRVGPPLNHWARRVFIAGMVLNDPDNLVVFIQNPQLIHERSAMPNVGASTEDARHMAAYLYTLR